MRCLNNAISSYCQNRVFGDFILLFAFQKINFFAFIAGVILCSLLLYYVKYPVIEQNLIITIWENTEISLSSAGVSSSKFFLFDDMMIVEVPFSCSIMLIRCWGNGTPEVSTVECVYSLFLHQMLLTCAIAQMISNQASRCSTKK